MTPVSSRDQSNQTQDRWGLVRLDRWRAGASLLSSQRLLSGDSSHIQDDAAGMCPLDEEFIGEAAAYCSVLKKNVCSHKYACTHLFII